MKKLLEEFLDQRFEAKAARETSVVACHCVRFLHPLGNQEEKYFEHIGIMAQDIIGSRNKLKKVIEECKFGPLKHDGLVQDDLGYLGVNRNEVFANEIAALKRARNQVAQLELENQVLAFRLAKAEGRTDEADNLYEEIFNKVFAGLPSRSKSVKDLTPIA